MKTLTIEETLNFILKNLKDDLINTNKKLEVEKIKRNKAYIEGSADSIKHTIKNVSRLLKQIKEETNG